MSLTTQNTLSSAACIRTLGAPRPSSETPDAATLIHDRRHSRSSGRTRPRGTGEGSRTRTPVPRVWAWIRGFPAACGGSRWLVAHRPRSRECRRAAASAGGPAPATQNTPGLRRRRSCQPRWRSSRRASPAPWRSSFFKRRDARQYVRLTLAETLVRTIDANLAASDKVNRLE